MDAERRSPGGGTLLPRILTVLGERSAFKQQALNLLAGETLVDTWEKSETASLFCRREITLPAAPGQPRPMQRVCTLPGVPSFAAVVESPLVVETDQATVYNWRGVASLVIVTLDGSRALTADEQTMLRSLRWRQREERTILLIDTSTWDDITNPDTRREALRLELARLLGPDDAPHVASWLDARIVEAPSLEARLDLDGVFMRIEELIGVDLASSAGETLANVFGSLAPSLSECLNAVEIATDGLGRPAPRVAFAGLFNAGKTTMINTMLGMHLPVNIVPTTMAVTRLLPGSGGKIRVLHDALGSEWSVIPDSAVDSLAQDASTHVIELGVQLPWEEHIWISDTPGLADNTMRTERTLWEIAQSDLVVILIRADQPLSEAEAALIERANEVLSGNVLLVINRMAMVRPAERPRLRAYIEARIAEIGNQQVDNREPFIIDVSPDDDAYPEQIAALRDRIAELVLGEGGCQLMRASRFGVLDAGLRHADQALLHLLAAFDAEEDAAIVAEHQRRIDHFHEQARKATEVIAEMESWNSDFLDALGPLTIAESATRNKTSLCGRSVELERTLRGAVAKVNEGVEATRSTLVQLVGFNAPPLVWDEKTLKDPYPWGMLAPLDMPVGEVGTKLFSLFSKQAKEVHARQQARREAEWSRVWNDMERTFPERLTHLRLDLEAYSAQQQLALTAFVQSNPPERPPLADASPNLATRRYQVSRLQAELAFEHDRLALLKGLAT